MKKFGRFGDAVVKSNMTVMHEGFSRVTEIKYGAADDPDRSSMRNPLLAPIGGHDDIVIRRFARGRRFLRQSALRHRERRESDPGQ